MASILMINGRHRALVRIKGHAASCKTFGSEQEARDWAEREEARIRMLVSGVYTDPRKETVPYQVSGVYMLLLDGRVRYIGRSVHIFRRLSDHDRKNKEWDSFRIIPCRDAVRMAEIEAKLIKKFAPELNVALRPGAKPSKRGRNKSNFTSYRPEATCD